MSNLDKMLKELGQTPGFREHTMNTLFNTSQHAQSVEKDINVPINDYISREALKKALSKELLTLNDDRDEFTKGVVNGLGLAAYHAQQLPSADVRENKIGVWERTPTGYPYCSECGWMPEPDEMTHGCYDFCPGCGADMRKHK